jgi:peroxiredoxin
MYVTRALTQYQDSKRRVAHAVLGISGQDAESKSKFNDKLGGLPFPLLIDEGDSVRKSFGVKKDLLGLLDVSVLQQKQRISKHRTAVLSVAPCHYSIVH